MFLTLNMEILEKLFPLFSANIQNAILIEYKVYKSKDMKVLERSQFTQDIVDMQLNETKKTLKKFNLISEDIDFILENYKNKKNKNILTLALQKHKYKTEKVTGQLILNSTLGLWFSYLDMDTGPEDFNIEEKNFAKSILKKIKENENKIISLIQSTTQNTVYYTPKLRGRNVSDILNSNFNIEDFLVRMNLQNLSDVEDLIITLKRNDVQFSDNKKGRIESILSEHNITYQTKSDVIKGLCSLLLDYPFACFESIPRELNFDNYKFTEYLNKLYNTEYIHLAPFSYQTLYDLIYKEFYNVSEINYWKDFKNTNNYNILINILLTSIYGGILNE